MSNNLSTLTKQIIADNKKLDDPTSTCQSCFASMKKEKFGFRCINGCYWIVNSNLLSIKIKEK